MSVLGGPLGDLAAGGGGAGEHDEVDVVDQLGADVAQAGGHLEDVRRAAPHSAQHSAISSEVSGVTSDGLRITELPAASAGMQSPNELSSG